MKDRRSFLKNLLGTGVAAYATLWGNAWATDRPPRLNSADFESGDFWDLVRAQFPLRSDLRYFNAATRGPIPYPVLDEFEYWERLFSESGKYATTIRARKEMAELLGIDEDELAFTRNTTEGINAIAASLPLKKKDEIIITTREHVGNALPWLNQMRLRGIVLRPFTPADTAAETLNRINALIGKRTRAIAVPHITSPTGTLLPVKEICALAMEKGLFSMIDGAQSFGQVQIDLNEMGCDFFASCFHKWYLGPAGSGFLFVKKGRIKELSPVHVGAYSDSGWEISEDRVAMDGLVDSAHLFEYGTHSPSLTMASVASVKFMAEIGMERVENRCRELAGRFRNHLKEMAGKVEILTPEENASCAGMVGFRVPGTDNFDFFQTALDNDFRVRYVPESGLNSLRLSAHIYNSPEEIDAFADYIRNY